MPSKIQLLSEETINQIAAGEVVESPASAVKELVENAIDAGSKKITIEIKGGGLQLIRISDDGCGMSEADATRCFERFATSKIRKLDDLSYLTTMGFRGEALAAIGSISKISLRTSEDGVRATLIEMEGGSLVKSGPCAHPKGASIEVRSLFYNVPARKKFQKSPGVCGAEVTRTASLLALAHVRVAFELIVQERVIFSSSASNLENRIQDILGEGFLADGLPVNLDEAGVKASGFIGEPLNNRPNRTGQYLFINERPVVCPQISFAVKDGYGTRLPADRYPLFVLHVTLAPEELDVNVHPQKKEVRILDERRIKELIKRAVSASLQKKELPHTPILEEGRALFSTPFDFSSAAFSFREEQAPAFKFQESASYEKQPVFQEFEAPELRPEIEGHFANYLFLKGSTASVKLPGSGGLILVDLANARSRLIFDSLVSAKENAATLSQGLLLPLTCTFNATESALLQRNIEEIQKLGISIRPIGKNAFIIDALPCFLEEDKVKELLLQITHELSEEDGKRDERTQKLALVTARMVSSERREFSSEEGLHFFQELMRSSSPYYCPNGKPTMVRITHDEISKLFALKKTP